MIQPSPFDVVYETPPQEPWEAMPVGGGDLTAMVRVGGKIELHLGKCDSWGALAQLAPDMQQLLSPGHITIALAPDPSLAPVLQAFEQRLSPLKGRIDATLTTADGIVKVAVWGDMTHHALIVEIEDQRRTVRTGLDVRLVDWRGAAVGHAEGCIISSREEISGTVGVFSPWKLPSEEPMMGRGIEVAVGVKGAQAEGTSRGSGVMTLSVPPRRAGRCRIIIACEVTAAGEPAGAALATLHTVMAETTAAARQRHSRWWANFWSKSRVAITGDEQAEFLTRQWHLFFYQKAIASRGRYPMQFNGGAGLFEADRRSWNLCYVWQNDREHLWPLAAGNHAELAENMWQLLSNILTAQRRFTFELWGIDGALLTERFTSWYELLDKSPRPTDKVNDTATAGSGGLGFERPGNYTTHLFSSGAEMVQQMLQHVRHSGDEAFLQETVFPWLAGVCEFYANFAQLDKSDGNYHFAPANATETWWKVKDALTDLGAIRVCFPEFIELAHRYKQHLPLAARCADILNKLPQLPRGQWKVVGSGDDSHIAIDRDADQYAPAAEPYHETTVRNHENPECYVIFPWSLTGIGAPDYKRACRTFAARLFAVSDGWSQCGVQAARLGLRDEIAGILAAHAQAFQVFPYGGWYSTGDMIYRKADGTHLADCSYFDSAGANTTAIQEMLLQSHPQGLTNGPQHRPLAASCEGGLLRVCPSVPTKWSGEFTLHAMGGFLVTAKFEHGQPTAIEIFSERGNTCRLASPWPEGVVIEMAGGTTTVQGETIEFETWPRASYQLKPAPGAG